MARSNNSCSDPSHEWTEQSAGPDKPKVRRCRTCTLDRQREWSRIRKEQVFNHYGRSCRCCGMSVIELLTLDHIVAVGNNSTRQTGGGFYSKLIRAGFPEGYQTLCFSCNSAKHSRRSVCPHQKMPDAPTGSSLVNLRCKVQTMDHYGEGRCGCCGESNVYMLTLHHVDGGGQEHRASLPGYGSYLYRYLRQQGWPNDPPLAVLCFNCNVGADMLGGCPCGGHRG